MASLYYLHPYANELEQVIHARCASLTHPKGTLAVNSTPPVVIQPSLHHHRHPMSAELAYYFYTHSVSGPAIVIIMASLRPPLPPPLTL